MRILLCIAAILALAVDSAPAAAISKGSWIDAAVAAAKANANAERSARAEALSALAQAQSIRDQAQQQNDTEALAIAQHAVEVAQAALDDVRQRVLEANAIAVDLQRYEHDPGTIDGAAVRLHGAVTVMHDGRSVAVASRVAPVLHDGDQVSTGNGTAEFFYRDGSSATLGPNTIYRVEHISALRSAFYLLKGEIHEISHRFQVYKANAVMGVLGKNTRTIRTGCCIVAVRGTAFDQRVDAANALHLRLYEGRVDIHASAESAAEKGGCREISVGEEVHIICGGSAKAVNYRTRLGGLVLTMRTPGCDVTVARDGSDVVVKHGTVSIDAGDSTAPAHGWWTDEP